MAEKKDSLAPICVLLRIQPGSNDPRHQKLLKWYETQPRGPAGRKTGIQTRIIDLIVAGIDAGETDQTEETPKKKGRRRSASKAAPSQESDGSAVRTTTETPNRPAGGERVRQGEKAQAETKEPPKSPAPAVDNEQAAEARTLMREMRF